ncbi:hypothetical protein NL676_021193 [Syzygium grande]|nr:hypothetical protein NL676_021193 [Syzygium grande]
MVGADDPSVDPRSLPGAEAIRRFQIGRQGPRRLRHRHAPPLLHPPAGGHRRRPAPGGGSSSGLEIPVIDLGSLAAGRPAVVERVLAAAREVGFFQVVNHGIPESALAGALAAARAFHELPGSTRIGGTLCSASWGPSRSILWSCLWSVETC